MTYLLDSTAGVTYLRGRNPHLRRRIAARSPTEIVLCSVVVAELLVGALRRPATAPAVAAFIGQFVSLPFDDRAAAEYARVRVYLELQGTPIGPYDLEIAAIALAHNVTLVTHNTSEFGRVPGLMIEDWEVP